MLISQLLWEAVLGSQGSYMAEQSAYLQWDGVYFIHLNEKKLVNWLGQNKANIKVHLHALLFNFRHELSRLDVQFYLFSFVYLARVQILFLCLTSIVLLTVLSRVFY